MRPRRNRALALILSAAMLSGSLSAGVMGTELPGETAVSSETQPESAATETQPESQNTEETQALTEAQTIAEPQTQTEVQTAAETELPTEPVSTPESEVQSENTSEADSESERVSEGDTETDEESDEEEDTEEPVEEEETESIDEEELETEDMLLVADFAGTEFYLDITTLFSGAEDDFYLPGLTYQVVDPDGAVIDTVQAVAEDSELVRRYALDEATIAAWNKQLEGVIEGEFPEELTGSTWTVKLDTQAEGNKQVLEYYDIVDNADPAAVEERQFNVVFKRQNELTGGYLQDEHAKVQFTLKAHDTLTVKAIKAGEDAKTAEFLKDAKVSLIYRNPDTGVETVLASKGIETAKEGETQAKTAVFSFDKDGADKELLSPERLAAQMGIAQDQLSALNGKELILRVEAPEGYKKKADEIVTLAYRGERLSVNRESDEADPIALEAVSTRPELNIVSLLNDSKKEEKVAGITYRIQYSLNNGSSYKDLTVQHVKAGAADEDDKEASAQFISAEDSDLTVTVDLWDEMLTALEALEPGQTILWKVAVVSSLGYKLAGKSAKEITLYLHTDEAGNAVFGTTATETQASAVFKFDELAEGSKSIRVVKRITVGDASAYVKSGNKVYYVALFDSKGVRISKPQKLTIKKGSTYASTTFKNLAAGTYYVREVEAGNANQIVPTKKTKGKDFYAVYSSSSTLVTDGYKVKLKSSTKTTPIVTITNKYETAKNTAFYGTFYIRFKWDNSADRSVKRPEKLYYKIYIKGSDGNYKAVTSNGQDAVYNVTFSGTETVKTVARNLTFSSASQAKSVRVVQVNADGSALAKDETNDSLRIFEKVPYEISYTNQDITVSANQTGTPPMVQITDKVAKVEEKETEDDSQLTASLTLTKKVTYKGEAIRVNAVYYIGVFDDAGLTNLRMKKAMRFKNASEVSATLKINLYKLKSKEATFYIAEVDKDGNTVGDGSKYGYEISQNKTRVTLNKDNKEDTVVITNNIKQGSRVESALTSSSSGFAGDSAALAQAQQLESEANKTAGSNTGDSTPLLPLTMAIVLSVIALIILGSWLMLRRNIYRRR